MAFEAAQAGADGSNLDLPKAKGCRCVSLLNVAAQDCLADAGGSEPHALKAGCLCSRSRIVCWLNTAS